MKKSNSKFTPFTKNEIPRLQLKKIVGGLQEVPAHDAWGSTYEFGF